MRSEVFKLLDEVHQCLLADKQAGAIDFSDAEQIAARIDKHVRDVAKSLDVVLANLEKTQLREGLIAYLLERKTDRSSDEAAD